MALGYAANVSDVTLMDMGEIDACSFNAKRNRNVYLSKICELQYKPQFRLGPGSTRKIFQIKKWLAPNLIKIFLKNNDHTVFLFRKPLGVI